LDYFSVAGLKKHQNDP